MPKVYDPSRRHDYQEFEDVCGTVLSQYGTGGGNVPIVVDTVYAFEGNGQRPAHHGSGFSEGTMYTLNATEIHGVAYPVENHPQDSRIILGKQDGIVQTLARQMGAGGGNIPLILERNNIYNTKHIIRRLTPLECCRLQGFPDWWENGVKGSQAERYKMWGNGVGLPNVCDVLFRIKYYLEKEGKNNVSNK